MTSGSHPGAHFLQENSTFGARSRRLVFTKSTHFWVSDLGWSPNTDILETEDALVIRVEIAGVDKDHIDVALKENTLSIRGHRYDPRRSKEVYFHQAEISYGPFEKLIILPDSLLNSSVQAKYRDGFLEIVISQEQASSVTASEVKIED